MCPQPVALCISQGLAGESLPSDKMIAAAPPTATPPKISGPACPKVEAPVSSTATQMSLLTDATVISVWASNRREQSPITTAAELAGPTVSVSPTRSGAPTIAREGPEDPDSVTLLPDTSINCPIGPPTIDVCGTRHEQSAVCAWAEPTAKSAAGRKTIAANTACTPTDDRFIARLLFMLFPVERYRILTGDTSTHKPFRKFQLSDSPQGRDCGV